MDLEATKVELSELASIVANKCSQAGFQCLKEMSGLHKPQVQTTHVNDGSTGSCLTSCEEALKEPDMHKTCIGLRTYHSDSSLQSHQRSGVLKYEQIQASGMEDLKKNKMNISSLFTEIDEPTKGDPPIFSMNSRTQEPKISCHIAYDHRKGADSKYPHFEHPYNRTYDRKSALQDKGKQPIEYGFSSLTPNLDLNMQVFGEDSEGNKQFDLNGYV
ncbi:hypothetical protein AXF42_Ash013746 [Apostasia shenzhenica]|uniref:Uncharacterized protein n=1 Tax=Apostasia shenzhenica TaxID=1088818 RepID=A0A2I0A4R9_9ASPA|nr:hypothetical protein AXF42_Ash013746 [Apostasia shenzhenica]